jgi:hypothetical protein
MDVYGIARVGGKTKLFFLRSRDLLERVRVENTAIAADEGRAWKEMVNMQVRSLIGILILFLQPLAPARSETSPVLPDLRDLMRTVMDHQKQLEKTRESYTYSSLHTTQEIDAKGQVKKTETEEAEDFCVNGHVIERTVKKNGRILDEGDQLKETERVTKLVAKAEKTPPGQPLEGPAISVSRLLEIMDLRDPRRVIFRGRPTIAFDFIGRKDAKTHGLAEDASKKLQGTVWIDEADRQVAHLEVSFNDNFRIAGGLFASIQKGSYFWFDQAPVSHLRNQEVPPGNAGNDELWLPTGGEGTMQARVLLVKSMLQHIVERDYDYKRFTVEAQQAKSANVSSPAKP